MTLYSPQTDPKYQHAGVPVPPTTDNGVVVSSDTLRAERLPNGQHRTPKWPVLHATSVPEINPAKWRLIVNGLVNRPLTLSFAEFEKLPRVKVFADFHCVTTWSRLGNLWEGVLARELLALAGVKPEAKFVVAGACDDGWTTNIPLSALLNEDVLLADTHDGQPLDPDHGGPVRLVVPKLFAWKSAKWLNRITLTADNQPGYWEQLGYHDVGDPWQGQRLRDVLD